MTKAVGQASSWPVSVGPEKSATGSDPAGVDMWTMGVCRLEQGLDSSLLACVRLDQQSLGLWDTVELLCEFKLAKAVSGPSKEPSMVWPRLYEMLTGQPHGKH